MSEFIPKNDLERQLLAAQNGEIPPETFFQTLWEAEVFLPVYEGHQIGGFQSDLRAKPLKLETEDGEILALFTHPGRARSFVQNFPGYEGGLVVAFSWILEKLGVGFGISLNPGEAVGLDLQPQAVAQLAAQRKK